jgi:uncharacterized protein YbaR (Trm112 family)
MPEPAHPDFAAVFPAIKDQLACPACRGPLSIVADRLACTSCPRTYPIVDGIPILISEDSKRD